MGWLYDMLQPIFLQEDIPTLLCLAVIKLITI